MKANGVLTLLPAFFLIAMTGPIRTQTICPKGVIPNDGRGGGDAGTNQTYIGTAVGGGDFANANLIDGDLGTAPVPFRLEITGFTSLGDTRVDAQILNTGGQEALLKALSNIRLGSLSLEGRPDIPVRFVQETDGELGLSVTVLCDRWLNKFVEGYEDMSHEYPFAYVEFSVANTGEGEGRMFTAAKIKFDRSAENAAGVEDYANYPDRLVKVVAAPPTGQ